MSRTSVRYSFRDDLLPWLAIFLGGLITAFICFTWLDSTAETNSGIPLTGGIVGALVSWSALSTIYLQLRRSSKTTDALQNLIQELESKVVRNAPLPSQFDREVDERHGLVLARPSDWNPQGGVLFSFAAPRSGDSDLLNAQLKITHYPRDLAEPGDNFYEEVRQFARSFAERFDGILVEETVRVGGQEYAPGVPSPKFTIQVNAQVFPRQAMPVGQAPIDFQYVSRDETRALVAGLFDEYMETFSSPRDQAFFAQIAVLRAQVKRAADAVIDSYQLDPHGGLAATVRSITDSLYTPAGTHVDSGAGSDSRPAADVGNASTSDAEEGASQVPRGPATVPPNVVPANRVLIATHYGSLGSTFLFDFVDNTGDFPASSALLNEIVTTVRFLA